MLRSVSLPLGRWRGCDVRLDPALPIALVYLGYTLAARYQLLRITGATAWAAVATGAIFLLLIGHELVHAIGAFAGGGRLRGATLAFTGARLRVAGGREAEVLSALAGPAFSIAAGIFLAGLGIARHSIVAGDLGRFEVAFGVANLLPAFPLDGGRVLRALASRWIGARRATELAMGIGRALALAAVLLALWERSPIYLFIAIFLYAGAVSDEHTRALEEPLDGQTAGDAMQPIAGTASVHDLIADVLARFTTTRVVALAVLATDGAPIGAIAVADLRGVADRDLWTVSVGDLIGKIGGLVPTSARLTAVRRQLSHRNVGAVAVVDEIGLLAGVLPLEAIDVRVELGRLQDARGSVNQNVAPWPGSDVTPTSPR